MQLPRSRRILLLVLTLAIVVGSLGFGGYALHRSNWHHYRANIAGEQAAEFSQVQQTAQVWAGANQQTVVPTPTSLKHLPGGYSGWLDTDKLVAAKNGTIILPPEVILEPTATNLHSLLVSRLHELTTYTVFEFKACKLPRTPVIAAFDKQDGIAAVLQIFNAQTPKCPEQPWL